MLAREEQYIEVTDKNDKVVDKGLKVKKSSPWSNTFLQNETHTGS